MPPEQPRIAPGTSDDIGPLNALIVKAIATRSGTRHPPHIFTTLARHRRLFRGWLWFAGSLMPGGKLSRADTELVILRVAHNCGCDYERHHHERLGRQVGLTPEEIERTRTGPAADGWTPRQTLLLTAADELHQHRDLPDELWQQLSAHLTEVQLIELLMLVGHYEMLATVIGTLRIAPDEVRRGG